MIVPANPKLYHILHHIKPPSIISEGYLYSEADLLAKDMSAGTNIGMETIKERRLHNILNCHPGLMVGQCVPFYFCPRSVMLYLIYRGNHENLVYRGGQEPIIHLEFDRNTLVDWSYANQRRWAFTLSNAGSYFFEARNNLEQLGEINWEAVMAKQWSTIDLKEGKQAEFLVEQSIPWELVQRIGVINSKIGCVERVIASANHHPSVRIEADWYY